MSRFDYPTPIDGNDPTPVDGGYVPIVGSENPNPKDKRPLYIGIAVILAIVILALIF